MKSCLLLYLFVQSGVLLVSHNGLSTFLQLSNVKPTQASAPADSQVLSTTLAAPQREL
jgi:hypothetical protein